MCGIAGFIDFERGGRGAEETLRAMTDSLRHRGPDDSGTWVDAETCLGLGHRRLAIIDLSPHGRQPMQSPCGRYLLTYNGEIYNHPELRRELECCAAGPLRWQGHSDTEVMLAAFAAWGVEGALAKFCGMFAFALWDRAERVLYLGRDRMGEKPLYYGWQGGVFLFASELKALRAHPGFRAPVDRDALTLFLRFSYLPAPFTIYCGIRALEPGCLLKLPYAGAAAGDRSLPEPQSYWSVRQAMEAGAEDPFHGSEQEAVEQLDALLRRVVAGQMAADVPLGAFLSGGIDSSTIVSLMQAQSSRPVKTFTIGFEEAQYDEAGYAREVARHLGTEHTELYLRPSDALEVIPRLPALYDEPFGDVSQIPTLLVSQLTKKHVTVSLSGDGGDELFAGYNRYLWVERIWRRVGGLPRHLRAAGAGLLRALSPGDWDRLFHRLGPVLPERLRQRTPGSKLHKLAGIVDAESPLGMYRQVVSQWQDPSSLVLGGVEPKLELGEASGRGLTETMMYLDMVSYLHGDILVKVDRATMGTSLESRTPYLDHRVVEFAWRLPLSLKIRERQGKWPLRQVLYRYVPRELIERPKAGFAVPVGEWLRGALRPWAEELLSRERMEREGFLDHRPVRRKWDEHLSGRYDWQHYLWNVLMFQAWLEENRP